MRLRRLEIQTPARPVKPFQNISVNLTLQQGSMPSISRAAQYQISLEPGRAVLRSDP